MDSFTDKTLDTLSLEDLNGASAAGVREISRTPTLLTARMRDARVKISADLCEVECSACGPVRCAHVTAALAGWVRRRKPVRRPRKLGLVDRLLSGATWKDLGDFAGDFLGKASGEVDLRDDGALEIRLRAGERTAILVIPKEEAPAFLWNLPRGLTKGEKLRGTRVSRRPLAPELRAAYDEKGRLVLSPVWGEGITPEPGARWHFDGVAYHPLDTVPRDLRTHFKGERILEGDDIPKFLSGEFRRLSRNPRFRPSEPVASSEIAPAPKFSALRVKPSSGDWLELEPVFTAGEERVALGEILAVRGTRKYLRKGNRWIPAEPGRRWNKPVRMRRAEFIFQRPDLPLEGDLPRFDPQHNDPPPKGLFAQLRSYQQTGYDWLRYLRRAGLHGILADDMGLGKTVQAIAFLLSLYEEGSRRPSLVVCPTSVLDPWIDKIRRFAPALCPYRYYGPSRKPEALSLPGQRVIVTSYAVLVRDFEALSAFDWECLILDEAQIIKTATTRFAQAAKRLTAGTRIALTGTPVENRLDELRSIFDFLIPGYLGGAEKFREQFEIPIMKRNDENALEDLKRRIAPFKLRRIKSEVLSDLPPKVEEVRTCDLSAHQAALYRAIVEGEGKALANDLRNRSRKVDYINIFAALSRLKRICDHPALVVPGGRASELSSGKFDVFRELLDEALRSDQKVVVFTQYLEMMDLIEAHLRSIRVGYADLRGNTRDRADALRSFQERERCRVFVASLLAGGVGIDLTRASVVIHYDRWWNAAREDQATDRVHRMGQAGSVQVFKLVTRGTLEEKIDRMIAEKGELLDTVVEVDAGTFRRFGRDELIELLTGADALPLARAI